VSVGGDVLGCGRNTQAEYAVLDSWAAKPPSIDWAVAAAAGVAGETSASGLRLLDIGSGDTLFVDGGAGGLGAVVVQMAIARGARVIASSSEANHDYLREIGATPVLYGEGVADRVRTAAGGQVDAVFDVAGRTPVEELISLVSKPSQVLSIANFAAGKAGARVAGGGADSRPMQALAQVAELLAENKLVIKVQTSRSTAPARPTASDRPATSAESSSWFLDRTRRRPPAGTTAHPSRVFEHGRRLRPSRSARTASRCVLPGLAAHDIEQATVAPTAQEPGRCARTSRSAWWWGRRAGRRSVRHTGRRRRRQSSIVVTKAWWRMCGWTHFSHPAPVGHRAGGKDGDGASLSG
jgi:hypothetical protein